MTPVFTIALSILFLGKRYSTLTYLSLLPLLLGVYMATVGDYSYSAMGFFLTLLGTALAAIKTVVTNRIQVGRLQLHPLDLLLRMSPLAFVQTVIFSWMQGELDVMVDFCRTKMSVSLVLALLVNGIIAFFLNYVSFTANKKTSALTMTVAGTFFFLVTFFFFYMVATGSWYLTRSFFNTCVAISQREASFVDRRRRHSVRHHYWILERTWNCRHTPWRRMLQVMTRSWIDEGGTLRLS